MPCQTLLLRTRQARNVGHLSSVPFSRLGGFVKKLGLCDRPFLFASNCPRLLPAACVVRVFRSDELLRLNLLSDLTSPTDDASISELSAQC